MSMPDIDALVRTFWRLNAKEDFRAAAAMMAPDATVDWPVSGERIPSPANWRAIKERYPGTWRFDIADLIVDGATAISRTLVHSDDLEKTETPITVFRFDGDRIARIVEYWPQPADPAGWRSHWVVTEPRPLSLEPLQRGDPTHSGTTRALVRAFWATVDAFAYDALPPFFGPDARIAFALSGERFRDPAAYAAMNAAYPGRWRTVPRSVHADGDRAIAFVDVFSADATVPDRYLCIACMSVADDRIDTLTEYWPEPEAPAPGRAPWVVPIPEGDLR
jgi:hypothetical protein